MFSFQKNFAAFLTSLCLLGAAQDLPLIITPDFSGAAVPPSIRFNNPNWKTVNGVLQSPDHSGKGLSGFSIGSEDWRDYEAQFRLRTLAQHPKDQHFGFSLRKGVSSYSRGNIMVLQIPERKIHAGFGKKFKQELPVGKNAEWTDFIVSVKGTTLTVKLNGEVVATMDDIPEGTGKFTFYAYQNYLEIADLCLKVYRKGNSVSEEKSPNAVLNASFEQCTLDGLPDYWGVPAWGLVEPEVIVNYYKEWCNRYNSDTSTAYHGKRSLRIVNSEDKKAKLSYSLWSCFLREKKDTTYTLSAYMKSDTPGMKILMRGFGLGGGKKLEKTVSLTTDWKRYEYTFTTLSSNGPVFFIPFSKGTFWIDAVQVEAGEKATSFQLADTDRRLTTHEGNPDKPLYDVPVHKTQLLMQSPKLDGDLGDPVWANITPVFLNSPNGKTVLEKTAAKIFYTQDGIYLGIDVQEADSGRIQCRKTKRDEYVWADPSIELFIDSKLTRATYHQLAFNADGVPYDNYLGNATWDGKWQVKTARKKDNSGWIAEVFLPFSDMNIDHNNTDHWGFNICRNNIRKGEISCWAPTYGGFHVPLCFGQLSIRADVQKRFIAGIKDLSLQYAGIGKNEFSGIVFNNTGAPVRANLTAVATPEKGGKPLTFQKQISLPDQKESKVVFGILPGELKERFTVETMFSDDNRAISSAKTILSVGNLLSALTQYNYCTTEKEMLLRGVVGVNAALLERSKLIIDVVDKDGKSIYKTSTPVKNGSFESVLPVGMWADGSYRAVCRLMSDNMEITAAESVFRKLPPSKTEVKIDRFRRITTVDGKPFFPLGFFWEGKLTPELIEFLAEGGVNFIHSYELLTADVLDAGSKNGIMFEMDILNKKSKTMNLEAIRNCKGHPAILCWYTYDEAFTGETGQKNPTKILLDIDEVRQADPYRPAVLLENEHGMNYLVQKGLDFPGDIPTVDYYAWPPSGNVQLWNNYSKILVKLAEKNGRPAWAVPFVSGYGYHASRDILPQEQEYQTYVCIINGCRGIAYWASFPKAPSSFRKIKQLFVEIKQIQEPLLSLEDAPEITTPSPDIRYTVKKHGDAVYLISVNESQKQVRVRFDLSSLENATHAEVMFEKRSVPLKNNRMEDTYEGFQRHVYKIRQK